MKLINKCKLIFTNRKSCVNEMNKSNHNPVELKSGMEIEKEHTDNPEIAKKIAIDHLNEDKDYYKKLIKMEKGD